MRKFILILALFLAVIASTLFFVFPSFQKDFGAYGEDCPFCDKNILERQKFYEDDFTIALYTHMPIVPGHILIIPKRHVERYEDLTDEEIVHIHHTIKKVHLAASKVFGTSPYLLLEKNGTEVGQSVPHVHFHYIPRKAGDYSTLKFLIQFHFAFLKKPMSPEEMKETVTKLKQTIT